ncbi:zinc finger protein CONSTANS-LIKE 16-like [Nymphaea colorata]|nr:zinc finger protein CONSTANS-LIKE 16-like [Nymphaea colorata]
MSTGMEKKVANAVGGKTARPCEDCRKRRARWYCAADDAFLCQACDAVIHSANPLAQRHERVRLKTSSSTSVRTEDGGLLPSWHKGFTRKARSVRPHPHAKATKSDQSAEPASGATNPLLVPELGDELQEENEEQLLYRVPIFDPMVGEFCSSGSSTTTATTTTYSPEDQKPSVALDSNDHDIDAANCGLDNFPCFLPSDVDLADFAADVESLLGRGLDDDSFCMEGLGLLDSRDQPELDCFASRVKVEEEDEAQERVAAEMAVSRDALEFNFEYDMPTTGDEEEEKVQVSCTSEGDGGHGGLAKRICLRLNYEAVITAWAGQGAPWTTGDRPQLSLDECWSDFMGMNMEMSSYGEAGVGLRVGICDGGREARVSRYREKRRTRLFSKKIRYEVRKLNAEKRPRMKGRFVKRTSAFAGPAAFPY